MSGLRVLCHLLAILAIVGLTLAPTSGEARAGNLGSNLSFGTLSFGERTADAAPNGANAPEVIASISEDMPCCPPTEPMPAPDCSKACPLAAFCAAPCPALLAGGPALVDRIPYGTGYDVRNTDRLDSLTRPPPPEPPRS